MANLLKKLFASVASMALVATSMNIGAIVSAQNISAEFTASFQWLQEVGGTTMATEDAFMPFNAVTRQQGAKMIVNGLKAAGVELTLDPNASCDFNDAASFNPTLVDFINEACSYGLIKGYGGNFWPTEVMNRAQVMTVIGRALYGQQPEPAAFHSNYYALLNADGIFTIENAYNDVMRYELALVLYRIAVKMGMDDGSVSDDDDLDNILCQLLGTCDDLDGDDDIVDDGDDTDDDVIDVPVGEVEGSLNVSLAPSTPVGGFVPGSASNVNVMKLDFLAADDPIRIDAVTVALEGFASRNNFDNVKIVDEDGLTLTNERAFTSDFRARLVFEGDFVVPANTVRSVFVYVETDGSTNEVFNLAVMNPEDIEANTVDVAGPFPLRGNSFQTTDYATTEIVFEGDSTTADTNASDNEELFGGEMDREVGNFRLTLSGDNNRDAVVSSLTLRSADTVEGVLDNFRLAVGANDNVASRIIVDNKYVTFIFEDDFVLEDGDSRTFYIYADVIGGEDGDTVEFQLDEPSDISAYELDTNASLSVSISDGYLEAYTIREGDSLISRRSDSPASTFIPNDGDYIDTLIANVFFSAAIDVEEVRVYATGDAIDNGAIERVRLFVDGKQVDETSSYTNGYYEFALFDIIQGSSEFIVKVDTENEDTFDGDDFQATLKADSFVFGSNAEYVATRNTVPSDDINGQAVGGTMTIRTPALTSLTRTDANGTTEEVVAGADDFEAITFVAQANNVRDLDIRGFRVEITQGDADAVSQVAVYVDGELIDVRSIGGTTANFSSLGIVVPKGGTTEISVLASVDSSYSSPDDLIFELNNFDVDDSEGNNLTTNATVTSAAFAVQAGGTLLANINTDTPDEQIITAGALYDIAEFELESVDDNGIVQELAFLNVGMGYTSGSALASDDDQRLTGSNSADGALVYIHDEEGNELGSATLTNGRLHFTFATAVELPRDNGGTVFTLKAQPKYINTAAASNSTIRLAMLEPGEVVDGSIRTFITSDANGSEITSATISNAVSKTQYSRKASLVVSNVAAPAGRLLTNGIGYELFKFQAATNNGETAKVKEFRFDVELGGSVDIDNFEFYRGNSKFTSSQVDFHADTDNCESANTFTGVSVLTGGSNCVVVTFTGTQYVDGFDIANTQEFTLNANVQGASQGGDSVSVRMSEVSGDATKDDYANTSAKFASIVWSDDSAQPTDLDTEAWYTDAFVEVLPTNAWSASASN